MKVGSFGLTHETHNTVLLGNGRQNVNVVPTHKSGSIVVLYSQYSVHHSGYGESRVIRRSF